MKNEFVATLSRRNSGSALVGCQLASLTALSPTILSMAPSS
jgi:hypothetical protein